VASVQCGQYSDGTVLLTLRTKSSFLVGAGDEAELLKRKMLLTLLAAVIFLLSVGPLTVLTKGFRRCPSDNCLVLLP
jgi:hypothetical protein